MDFDELQKMQYKIFTIALDHIGNEEVENCIFDIFWSISNLLKLMTKGE